MMIRLFSTLTAGFLIFAACADPKTTRSKRAGEGSSVGMQNPKSDDAEVMAGEDLDSYGDMLKLAQNMADKQKSAGEGICSEGACLTDTSTCSQLNFGNLKYTLSDDGSKCVLDAKNSCEAWEKKGTAKMPAWDKDEKKWIPIDVEVCVTDEATCNNTTFNKNSTWYKTSSQEVSRISYFKEDGGFRYQPQNTGADEVLRYDEVKETVAVCERQDDYCKDSFGDLSSATFTFNQGTLRSTNACSASPKYCRTKDMYLNPTNIDTEDENSISITDVEAIEWESECVEQADFKASSLVCKAHGMEFDQTNKECYSDTKASCDASGKIWVTDDLISKYTEILKSYKYLYDLDKKNNQETKLNYAGFVYVDHTMNNYQMLGLSKEEASFKGMYPVKPGKRCQYPNIETCKLINQIYDPYENKCVDTMKRNLMLVLRKIEIDNSLGCIDHWLEREGPNASEMAQNVAGAILTLGIMPAMGGWNDGKDVRKEAPFTYEVGDFKFLTSTGEGGELLKKPINNIAIPHKNSYAFLVSKIFPVEVKGAGFNFSVKFDVFVKGKALTTGKLLFGSVLEDFFYTDTHFPYKYRTLWRSKDNEDRFNNIGLENLFAELKGELSRYHIASATAAMSEWFKEGVTHSRLDGAEEDNEIAKDLAGNSSTRLSYTLNRSNWDDSIHKIAQIIHFNPTQVYSEEVARGGIGAGGAAGAGAVGGGVIGGVAGGPLGAVIGASIGAAAGGASGGNQNSNTGLQENEQQRCYGRLVWSWQWFKG